MVNTEDEFWKDVVGYGDLFSVSNKGQIFSKRTDKVLKQNPVSTKCVGEIKLHIRK